MNSMPLMVIEGDYNTVDLSKLKRKLVSGEHSSGSQGVIRETRWPHHCLSRVSTVSPPSYDKLSIAQFWSGFTNKIISELNPSLANTELENKLKHMSNMANMALTLPWDQVLAFNAVLFRCIEQQQLDWNDWDAIQDWHAKSLNQLKTYTVSNNGLPGSQTLQPDNKKQKLDPASMVVGLSRSWLMEQKFCIMFQLGKCKESADHKTKDGNITLVHHCGGCFKVNSTVATDHGAEVCPNKHLF